MTATLKQDERGSADAAALPFGFLFLAAATLIVLTTPTWIERGAAARAAADQAARAVATADSWEAGAEAARLLVDQIAVDHGLERGGMSLRLSGSLARGATVTAEVTVTIPATDLPLVGSVGSLRRTVSHSEPVDAYRSFP